METIIDKVWPYPTHIYERVEEIPFGYIVWNIGRDNFPHERSIPLAKPGYNGSKWHIDPNSLKYIVVNNEELALKIIEEAKEKTVKRERFYEIVKEYDLSTSAANVM